MRSYERKGKKNGKFVGEGGSTLLKREQKRTEERRKLKEGMLQIFHTGNE